MRGARTPKQALDRYRYHLQLGLSRVGSAVWRMGKPAGLDQVLITEPDPVRLKRPGSPLYLKATQKFELGHPKDRPHDWKVVTTAYAYTVSESPDLTREIWAWHWHATLEQTRPHIHIGRGDPELGTLAKLHIPTGRVSFEEVLLFVIEDCGVKPVRADWKETLTDRLEVFNEFRTWA